MCGVVPGWVISRPALSSRECGQSGPAWHRGSCRFGVASLYGGSLDKALADISQASELDPKDAYAELWLDVIGQRSKVQSRLSDAVAKLDMTEWPAPVVRLFMGQTTAASVLAAADDPVPMTKAGQICEANSYAGELALRQGPRDEAIRLFRLAASDRPRSFTEQRAAVGELKLLGLTP